jgi:ADP-ribose pyrophosphatase
MEEDKRLFWKVLSSEYIHKDTWLTARKESVQMPSGHVIEPYYVLDYPNWVNTIAITKDGKFVFVKQYRHGLRSVNFELCAGMAEKTDPSPMVSAKRELLEETGYGNGTWSQYMVQSANPSTHSNLNYCFLAVGVEKIQEQELEDSEDISVHLLSAQQVKQLLDENKIMQSLMAAPLWKYFYENKL